MILQLIKNKYNSNSDSCNMICLRVVMYDNTMWTFKFCSGIVSMYMSHGINIQMACLFSFQAQILNLSNNHFTTFPEQLENFSKLDTLDMSGNYLSRPLPGYMEMFINLNTLNLSNNNYETWMGTGFTYSITILDLSKNKINTIDEAAIVEMPYLYKLDLSENRIYSMPSKMFAGSNNLDTLILSRNYFSDVPTFQSTSLRNLHLSSCQISSLNADSLAGMNSLLEIDLSINQIEYIPDNIVSNTLQELDLSYNEIGTLTDSSFSSLQHLAVLNLRGNEFREVWPTSRFASNPFLREVHVKGNRWSCEGFSINLLLTYDFLLSKVSDKSSLMCYSPLNVTQLSWQQAYLRTWHFSDSTESFTVVAVMIGVIIGILITSFVCRGLMAMNTPAPAPAPARETAVLNLNGATPQARVESVVMRVPLHEEDLPPSYDEALLMPRLNSSFHSLPDFVDEEEDTNRRYRRSRSIGDLTNFRPRAGDRRSVRRTVEIHIS